MTIDNGIKTNFNKLPRIEWIDCAKGITILLVIVGHTLGGILRGAIFSFHMPLFFILSCVTFRYSKDKEQFVTKTERAFMHLVVPAIVMYFIVTVIFIVKHYALFTSMDYIREFTKEKILTGVFASGVSVPVLTSKIPAIGIPWFFVVLFLGRTFFDYLNLKLSKTLLFVWCIILSAVGVCFGKTQWLPLSFDIALAIMPMFYVGTIFEKFQVENKPVYKLFIDGAIWAGTLFLSYLLVYSYMELACRRYPLYPLCYITAIAGTLMVVEFSVILNRFKKIVRPISYLGKNSLYMLCIHILDSSLFIKFWNITDNPYANSICRIFVDSIVFIGIMFFIEKIRNYK